MQGNRRASLGSPKNAIVSRLKWLKPLQTLLSPELGKLTETYSAVLTAILVTLLQEKLETHFSVRLNAAIAKIGLTYHYQETGDRAYASFPYRNYEVRIICE